MLTPPEMQYFYEEQLHRMECLSQEPVAFADVLCQLHDMLSPEVRSKERREKFWIFFEKLETKTEKNLKNLFFFFFFFFFKKKKPSTAL